MKVVALLMPREMRIESTSEMLSSLSDEHLQAMIAELSERIERKLSGEDAKVIEAKPLEPAAPSPPMPTPGVPRPEDVYPWKPVPKTSAKRRLAAAAYQRKRRAAKKAAKQTETEKSETEASSPPAPPTVH